MMTNLPDSGPGGDLRDVTMRDIANACDVSIQTVSRILRGHGGAYRSQTAQRVMDTARRLGYQAPWESVAKERRRPTLGGIIDNLDNNLAASRWGAISQQAKLAGYDLCVTSSHSQDDPSRLLAVAQSQVAMGVKGIFIMRGLPVDRQARQALSSLGVPVVFLDWGPPNVSTRVIYDRQHALDQIAQHLSQLGHESVGYMARLWTMDFLEHKLFPLRRALSRRGMKLVTRPAWLIDGQGNVAGRAYEATQALMAGPREVTALVCGNDVIALAAMAAVRDMGLAVPGDISIVGFDDLPVARFHQPALTTVRAPVKEVGLQAMQMMRTLLQSPGQSVEQVTLQYQLVVRESTGPAHVDHLPSRLAQKREPHLQD